MILSTSPGFLRQNFISQNYTIRDTSLTSPNYFDITFFPDQIGGGVSLIKLRGNEDNLAFDKQTQVEILDGQGTPVRHEIATHIDRFQNYYISIYVYDTTAPGIGSVSIVGVAKREPRGEIIINQNEVNDLGHNLIWTRPITILPNARNSSELVFDDPPFVSVAQVIAPARVAYNANIDTQYSAVTASNLTIATTRFKGFDKKRGSNYSTVNGVVKLVSKDKITDNKAKSTNINVNSEARTVNYVEAPTRMRNVDIVGGFVLNEETRYNTVVVASSSFFSSSYIGGTMQFFTSSITLSPSIPSGYEPNSTNPYDGLRASEGTQSISDQLSRWSANIVKIKDDRTAFIDQPVQANLRRVSLSNTSRGYETKHTFYDVRAFTASILYTPDSLLYTTSSEVSQSYLQFTIQDLNPIGGLVDKIRVYYRRGSEIGDWELLQDQYITPVEFLTDARYPNQTSYGLDISDYYLLGHFIDQTVISNNWSVFTERATTFDTATASLDNSTLLNSAKLVCSASISQIITTRFYQNYANDSVYTLSFNCILGPYTRLELYENSSTLQTTVFGSDPFPRAFDKTLNYQTQTYPDHYNRYGKLIGKINNNTNTTKDYTRVVFDFKTDKEGLGRPMFRVVQTNSPTTSSAHISQISVTPRQLSGFTPRTVQFAFPAKLDTNIDLNETVDYKLEYYDYTGNQSEYVTYLEDIRMELQTEIPTTACQTEQASFRFQPVKYYLASYLTANDQSTGSVLINFPTVGFYYSILTGTSESLANLPEQYRLWPDWDLKSPSDYTGLASFVDNYFKGFQNYFLGTPNLIGVTTTGSLDLTTTGNFWNALRPSMSIVDGNASSAETGYIARYPFTWSYDFDGAGPLPTYQAGNIPDLAYGTITSSWQYIDNFTIRFTPYLESSPEPPFNTTFAKGVYRYAYTSASTNTLDGRIFWEDGGMGISQLNVSNSYYSYSMATTNSKKTEALKKRRLYWPALATTHAQNNYFTENGGIYNVKFKLKRRQTGNTFTPDAGTFMRVYIFDVSSSFTSETNGLRGWYPPPQNIVSIGNNYTIGGTTVPAISFTDSSTGYSYDEYNINLVQYGTPAQLVFEACGDTATDAYFGIIIDDVEFCKIGKTTDPFYIKPQLVASSFVQARTTPIIQGGGGESV